MTLQLQWRPARSSYLVGETDTHLIELIPMIFNHRLVLTPKTDERCYDRGWCYGSYEDAVAAIQSWDPAVDDEPSGYLKRLI